MQIISTVQYGRNLGPVSTLSDNDVVHCYDVFDQAYVNNILTKGTPGYFVNDHITAGEFEGIQFVGLPLFAEKETKKIINKMHFDDNVETSVCFNFMINKKQINRFLCIKLVEWFKLNSFDYTWSAVDQQFDLSHVIAELDQLADCSPLDPVARSFILSPIQLKKKFIEFPNMQNSKFAITEYGGNKWSWDNGLQQMFLKSAISLVTETVATQRAAVFTEKTLYPVLALNFPIWIGGYNQAKEWSRFGFDVFDDIIDHSYQSYDTLIERIYYAFADNLELLSDLNKVSKLRLELKDRLLNNRNLLLQNQLGKFIDREITRLPTDLQSVMPSILTHFRH